MKNQSLIPLAIIITILAAIFGSGFTYASDVKVIANSSVTVDTISAGEIQKVFLEQNNSLHDGTHVEPVLERSGPVHEAFLQQYVGRTDNDLQNYYRVLVFTGRGSMPKQLSSDAEVVAYVARNRGAIGYVSAETSTEGVKTISVGDVPHSAERKLISRVEPDYPETLKRLNIGGTVRLQVTIGANGKVEKIELLGGNPILGACAIDAVKQWVYASGHSRTVAEITIPFGSQH